ncbi:hypothetical protein KJ865_07795, partial [Myxococcota bacterium]|nr:hypothetical protein [Myxococcota bacterium]
MSAPSPVWVTLGTHASKNTARDFTAAIRGSKNPGNRLHNYLTVLREEKDGQRFRTIVGPFFSKVGAFRFGVNLLNKNGRVRSFMLTRFDGSTVSLSMSRSQRKTIIPSLKPPFPQMGLVVYPLALGWPQALSRLGSRAAATVSQGFRDEIWLTAEKSVCSGPSCKTWYKGITPSPHQLAWFQAGQVIPLRTVRSLLDEKGKLINYTSVSPIGTDDNKLRYQAIRFL